LKFTPDRLIVSIPALLARDFDAPRNGVVAVAIDAGQGDDMERGGLDRRFPVVHPGFGPRTVLGWLWVPDTVSAMPLLSVERHVPNLAVIFRAAVPVPKVRRESMHGPLNGERIGGFFIAVEDPDAAREQLAMWTQVRDLEPADLEGLYPRSAEAAGTDP
jgi:hypothetical protein